MNFTALLRRLAQADIAFYVLPFLMINLAAGTMAQRELGLYQAQKLFFGSFVLWAGQVPFPGFYVFTGLLAFSLLLKFLIASEWEWSKAGIHLTHLGVLVLLIGGLLTALTAREGYMIIGEGESSPYVYDYHQRDLFVFENDNLLQAIPFQKLKSNAFSLPFILKVKEVCENCTIVKRDDLADGYQGMARFMKLESKKPEKEPEENISGVTFDLADETYIAFEGMPTPIEFNKYKIIFGREQRLLPFSVKLQDFNKETYPGIDKARSYSSDVVIQEQGTEWPVKIGMNAPLRYKGHTFYQSSFEESPDGDTTVLSVVENRGRLFPYIGTLFIAAGLLLHLLMMTNDTVIARSAATKQSSKKSGLLRSLWSLAMTISLLVLLPQAAHARQPVFDYAAFRAIPILDEGRVKPLDTYARIKLQEFSGKETGANKWLAETLFDPPTAAERPVFLVSSADLKTRLGLDQKKKLFTLAEMHTSLRKVVRQTGMLLKIPPENLTHEQKQLLQLQENVLSYNRLLRSFSLLLPLNLEIPSGYKISAPADYLSVQEGAPLLAVELQTLVDTKGTNTDFYTEDEKRLAALGFGLQQIRDGGAGNAELKVLVTGDQWMSPWQAAFAGKSSADMRNWRALAAAYRSGDAVQWNAAAKALVSRTAPEKFRLEVFYNLAKPFHMALLLYCIAFISLLVFLLVHVDFFVPYGLGILGGGLIAHLFGIVTRVIVLSRPPVGTLYEAVLFVSFICALVGFMAFAKKRNGPAMLSGLVAAILLLTLAPVLLQQGESMEMLVAVLNTNFWLGTHVLCITSGYGLSILAACLAHAYLLAKITGRDSKMLQQSLYTFSIAALLLTAVGTALGGIWADQSWGRFWGWDPKENGALMIVLWLAWLQHGRLGNKLDAVTFAVGTAFLNIVVALAWFGVNLLSVGLHSYGFTNGIAQGLSMFCAADTILISLLWLSVRRKHAA